MRLKRWGDEASRICNENRQTQKIPDKNANSHVKKTLRIIHTESLVRVEIERGKNEVSALISCQSCKHKSFLLSPISCFCARSKIIFITCVRAQTYDDVEVFDTIFGHLSFPEKVCSKTSSHGDKKHFRAKTVKRARPRIQTTRYSERLEKPLEKRKKKEIDLHPDAVMRDRLNCYFPFDCSQSERKAYFSNFAPSLIRSYSSFQTGMKKVMKVWPAMLSLCLLALTPL